MDTCFQGNWLESEDGSIIGGSLFLFWFSSSLCFLRMVKVLVRRGVSRSRAGVWLMSQFVSLLAWLLKKYMTCKDYFVKLLGFENF